MRGRAQVSEFLSLDLRWLAGAAIWAADSAVASWAAQPEEHDLGLAQRN